MIQPQKNPVASGIPAQVFRSQGKHITEDRFHSTELSISWCILWNYAGKWSREITQLLGQTQLGQCWGGKLVKCSLFQSRNLALNSYRLAGLVVKAFASGVEDPGFESRLSRDFSGSSHTSDFKIGTPVATLPGA